METLIIFLYYIIVESTTNASIVPPKTINSTHEYYIASKSSSFVSNSIQCSSANCAVTCDEDQGCRYMTINASLSDHLILNCLNSKSCQSLSELIGPSVSAEIYCLNDNSCSNGNFNLNDTTNVQIECDGTASCGNININAEYATNVMIECINTCSGLYLNVNHTDISIISGNLRFAEIIGIGITTKLELHCTDSLMSTLDPGTDGFYCPNNALCNVICDGSTSCQGHFYVNSNNIQNNNYFNLSCVGNRACQWMRFKCLDINDYSNGNYYNVIEWDDGDQFDGGLDDKYECTDDRCCPFPDPIKTIYCPSNLTECVINCADYGHPYYCSFQNIDIHSNITSLTINCGGGMCAGTHIEINKTIESFTLNCLASSSCRYMTVDIMVQNSANIMCTAGITANPHPCADALFNIKGIPFVTNYTIVSQTYGFRVSTLKLIGGNHVNIDCSYPYSCDYSDFVALNMTTIDIKCDSVSGVYACLASNWNIDAINDISIQCNERYACWKSNWNVNTSDIVFECPSNTTDQSCAEIGFVGNIKNSFIILSQYPEYAFGWQGNANYASDLDISCLDCINIHRCSQNITFYCGAGSSLFPDNSNDECRNCQCDERGYNESIYTDNPWNECLPTSDPTQSPTMYPTIEPSFNPSTYPTEPTGFPTTIPTTEPTFYPTIIPTNIPTNNPTKMPSVTPSRSPSFQPITSYPTSIPTIVPTNIPTIIPTNNPTAIPTIYPLQPTVSSLTKYPTELHPTTTTIRDITPIGDAQRTESNLMIFIIIGIIVVIIIFLGVIVLAKCHQKGKQTLPQQMHQMQKMPVIQPQQVVMMIPVQTVQVPDGGGMQSETNTEANPIVQGNEGNSKDNITYQ